MSFKDLPDDMIIEIAMRSDYDDVNSMCLTNRVLKDICMDNQFWYHYCIYHDYISEDYDSTTNYRAIARYPNMDTHIDDVRRWVHTALVERYEYIFLDYGGTPDKAIIYLTETVIEPLSAMQKSKNLGDEMYEFARNAPGDDTLELFQDQATYDSYGTYLSPGFEYAFRHFDLPGYFADVSHLFTIYGTSDSDDDSDGDGDNDNDD